MKGPSRKSRRPWAETICFPNCKHRNLPVGMSVWNDIKSEEGRKWPVWVDYSPATPSPCVFPESQALSYPDAFWKQHKERKYLTCRWTHKNAHGLAGKDVLSFLSFRRPERRTTTVESILSPRHAAASSKQHNQTAPYKTRCANATKLIHTVKKMCRINLLTNSDMFH